MTTHDQRIFDVVSLEVSVHNAIQDLCQVRAATPSSMVFLKIDLQYPVGDQTDGSDVQIFLIIR
jgi:hypothetical protein